MFLDVARVLAHMVSLADLAQGLWASLDETVAQRDVVREVPTR
jgi:hypothetical protein